MAHKIDSAVLAQRIRELDGLTNDERSALLELLNTQKHYGLVWEDKPEQVEERLREQLPVLTEVKHRAIINGSEHPNHIIIEGDNLEALTALSYTHEGKIDVIYIDPPYNTGNKDFVYNDNYVDAEDGYRHSKWLSFMSRRLKIAKHLLSDKGVIFISIDDNEQANLKLLCDEVFGEKNYRNTIFARRRVKALNLQFADDGLKTLNVGAEYVIVYGMRDFLFKETRAKKDETKLGHWCGFWSNANRPTMRYELLGFTPKTGQWRWSKELAMEAVNNYKEYCCFHSNLTLDEYWEQTGKHKKFIKRDENGTGKNGGVYYWVAPSDTNLRTSNWTDIEVSQIIKEFDFPFNNPKNKDLIKEILKVPFLKTSTILDFFAGSGTTLHATMQLNAEDGGHRQCILVTNNENNICEEVTYERNKRVINGYTTPRGVAVEGLHENNLRYYKIGFVPRENTLSAKRQLMAASTDLLCIKNDIYAEQLQFGSLTLKPNIARYFEENGKRMLVIFREEAIEKLVAEIKLTTFDEPIVTYVFSSNNYAMDADFEEVEDKVSLCALPAAIYNAYQKVLPKRKMKNTGNEDVEEIGEPMEEQQKLDFGKEETL